MKERPILFSGEMVRAILDGRKTQTRRIWKMPKGHYPAVTMPDGWFTWEGNNQDYHVEEFRCPYGAVGDRLWVRETWAHYQTVNHIRRADGRAFDEVSDGLAGYRADGHESVEDFREHVRLMSDCDLEEVIINGDRWRPSIHMPRWASRITLEINGVWVERLKDISHEDAAAEGWPHIVDGAPNDFDPRTWYSDLWERINGAGSWAANPWVWVIEFKRIEVMK